MKQCACFLGFLVLVVALPDVAKAHHPVSEYGIAWTEPVSFVELDAQYTDYNLDNGREGHWMVLAPSGEVALHEKFSLTFRVPLVSLEEDGGQRTTGVGDMEAGAKVGLYASDHGGLVVSVGTSLEMPTGDKSKGLSSGHYELVPYITFSTSFSSSLSLYGLLADRHTLGDDNAHNGPEANIRSYDFGLQNHSHDGADGHHAASVTSAHSSHETALRLGAAYTIQSLYISGGWEGIMMHQGPRKAGPQVARAELGMRFSEHLRLAMGADMPFAGEERYSWRARTGLAWTF